MRKPGSLTTQHAVRGSFCTLSPAAFDVSVLRPGRSLSKIARPPPALLRDGPCLSAVNHVSTFSWHLHFHWPG